MPTPSDTLACVLAGLSVYGAASLGHDLYRAGRTLVRSTRRSAEWTATKWRAYAVARDRRAALRRDGTVRDLAAAVEQLSRARARTPAEAGQSPEIPTALARPTPEPSVVVDLRALADTPQAPAAWPPSDALARYRRCLRYSAFTTREAWGALADELGAIGRVDEAADCRLRAGWPPSEQRACGLASTPVV